MNKILYWLLNRKFKSEFTGIDLEKMNDWLLSQSLDLGFISYFKYRDLTILKDMGRGLKQNDYWKAVGQRTELLMLVAKINELKKLNESKKYGKTGISNKVAKG